MPFIVLIRASLYQKRRSHSIRLDKGKSLRPSFQHQLQYTTSPVYQIKVISLHASGEYTNLVRMQGILDNSNVRNSYNIPISAKWGREIEANNGRSYFQATGASCQWFIEYQHRRVYRICPQADFTDHTALLTRQSIYNWWRPYMKTTK